ncbi:MAG: putative lipoprotein, partial [Algoriphagus marincola HL-49]
MKNNFPKIITMLSLLVVSWACDNGFADIDVIDTPPKITLGSITSGLTEEEDFSIAVTLDDGTDDGAVSSLASLDYTITSEGATVASGSEALSGDQQTVTITVPGGFDAGTYNLDVVVSDTNGNTATDNITFEVASAQPDFDITGTWVVEPVAASL